MPVQKRRRAGIVLTALAAKKIRARRLRAKAAALVGHAVGVRKGRKVATLALARRKGRKISARRIGAVKRAAGGMR